MCTIQKTLHFLFLKSSNYSEIQSSNTILNYWSKKTLLLKLKIKIFLNILLDKILLSFIDINQLLKIINFHGIMYLFHINNLHHLLIDLFK